MSIVQNPLIGKARRSMGGATFSSWKGINVLKTKPLTVANPRSDAQVARRSIITQLVAIFRLLPAIIDAGFKEQAVKQSPYNAFVGTNANTDVFSISGNTATLNFDELKMSKGTIAIQYMSAVVIDDSANTIVFSWSAASLQPGQSTSDKLVYAVYNTVTEEWQGAITNVSRSAETASISQTISFNTGVSCRCYAFFINLTTGKASNNTETSVTVVA